MITHRSRISSKNEQLQIVLDSGEHHSVPIEDINSVMIESEKVQISSHVLQKLVLNGTVTFLCDRQHMPCGILLPLNVHSRQLKIINNQLSVKKPLNKRLWQQIVQQKIINQAECLRICGKEGHLDLYNLHKKVQSGDVTYIESQAAAKYFRLLYGDDFRRYNKRGYNNTDIINSALNYGYAILRGAIARTLVVYGFEPSLGIFHHNETNRFNLADDLIEPFRPVVDLFTFIHIKGDKFTSQHKQNLYGILNYEIMSANEKHSVIYSIERMVKSLTATYQNNCGQLNLPVICPLKTHTFE
ncbi:MAG TPA: type II CRISPR-associated endonuclease Cas1 [Syntrophomonas sp.]|jgi:CRISPR-associated protein Cas1|nr:type II CRISPR-associated endonuclease Cas1 [Syntrophomonas sp.]